MPSRASTAATQDSAEKWQLASQQAGWTYLDCPQVYAIGGESDWKPFVQRLQDCGAEVVYFTGSPAPNFENVLDAAKQIARNPRGMENLDPVGVFAQRTKFRPNPIGVTAVELLAVDDKGVTVRGLDALDGTPVLDIKPYIPAFERKENVRLPAWVDKMMDGYF